MEAYILYIIFHIIGGSLKYHKEVISLPTAPPPALWTFFDYGTKANNLIERWLSEQPEEVQDLFEAVIKTNRKIEDPKNWSESRKMEADLAKEEIWEFRVRHDNVQYRLLGSFGQSRKQGVLLIGCTHKMKVYDPHDCLRTAIRRARAVKMKEEGVVLRERKIKENI